MIIGLIFFVLLGLKIYAGIAAGIYIVVFASLLAMKGDIKWRDLILQICILALVGLFTLWAMYGLGRGGGNKTFVYDPFAFIRSLIDDPNHFFRREIALARTYLEAQGKFSPRLILLYGAGILMFYVVNFGTRIVSLSQVVYGIKHRNLTPHQLALWITITIVSIVPLFFVQNGNSQEILHNIKIAVY
jgi:hypothetical protein